MSEARERYYKNKGALIGCDYNIVNPYIKELEQQNKELKEALRLCMTWLKKVSKSMPNYDITQSTLWKNFKELLK